MAGKRTTARSAKSGEFVSPEEAAANPDTTVVEEQPIPYAVVGEDGRRVTRRVPKTVAEQVAAALHEKTGETFTVEPDLPGDA